MAKNTNTERIASLEASMENLNKKFDMLLEAMTSNKPSAPKGAKASKTPKTPKATKELKTYEAFEKSTALYVAKSVDSKGGNPNALLQVKFASIPSAKHRALLKAYGFRWNKPNESWDNANTDEAKEVFDIIK